MSIGEFDLNNERLKESEFTQYLSRNLELIERGLTLIAKEVWLRDPEGASGRVDIVARDRYRNTVVIEVKCSNKVAREAAHELFKYSEILRTQQRLSESNFRCILVSTEWKELHRPFTAYAARHHDVVGYRAVPDSSGEGWVLSRVEPLERVDEVHPTSAHTVYLYESPERRKSDFRAISRVLVDVGIPHHFAFMLENKVSPHVVYRYAIYLVAGTATRPFEEFDPEDLECYSQDQVENYLIDNILTPNTADDIEIGSPEKLRYLLSTVGKWQLTGSERVGAFAERAALHDDDLLSRSVKDLPGFADTSYTGMTSPARRSHWMQMRKRILGALPDPETWQPQIDRWLDEAEVQFQSCDFRVGIFDAGIIRPLMEFSGDGPVSSPMILRADVLHPDTGDFITGVEVSLRWNGKTRSKDIYSLIERVTGAVFSWFAFCPPPEDEMNLAHSLGLQFHVYELKSLGIGVTPVYRLEMEGGELARRDWDNLCWGDGMVSLEWRRSVPFYRFWEGHVDSIRSLQEKISHSVVKIVDG